MYFDTHAHYDDKRFSEDLDDVLNSMHEHGVELIVNAGCDLASSYAGRDLAEKYPFVYFSAGVHPHDAKEIASGTYDRLRKIIEHPKCVAVGEIGLDYYYDNSERSVQRQRFYEQMELAREVKKPVIIHEREACKDVLDIVSEFKDLSGVYHCFSGSWETAKTILDMGWYLSFTGVVTFKNARKSLEVVEQMPADRIMIETDSPYLAPVPNRGKRNDSRNLVHVAEKIAQVRNISAEDAAALTLENGKRFFGIL